MTARYIIFDGHIPVVFPTTLPSSLFECRTHSEADGLRATSSGECFYDPEKGWKCRAYVVDCGWIDARQDAEILNRHLCN